MAVSYIEKRQQACLTCPENSRKDKGALGRCKSCGCFIQAKTLIPFSTCPLSKWGEANEQNKVLGSVPVPPSMKVVINNSESVNILRCIEVADMNNVTHLHFTQPVSIPPHGFSIVVTSGGMPVWVQQADTILVATAESDKEVKASTKGIYSEHKSITWMFGRTPDEDFLAATGWHIVRAKVPQLRKSASIEEICEAAYRDIDQRTLDSSYQDDEDFEKDHPEVMKMKLEDRDRKKQDNDEARLAQMDALDNKIKGKDRPNDG